MDFCNRLECKLPRYFFYNKSTRCLTLNCNFGIKTAVYILKSVHFPVRRRTFKSGVSGRKHGDNVTKLFFFVTLEQFNQTRLFVRCKPFQCLMFADKAWSLP
jgi:hypothetical protein